MGALMLLGLIGSVVYSGYVIKNDIKAEKIDKINKPTINTDINKRNIKQNFTIICERAGIKLSKTGKPIDIHQCHKGMEYLQYQGYDNHSVQYFKQLFQEKFKQHNGKLHNNIDTKHKQLLNIYNNSTREHTLITYRHNNYGNEPPAPRMQALMENHLWNKIVDNYTYIHGINSAKYTEIWNLKVPNNFFNHYDIDTLYKEICWKQNKNDGGFL